MARQMAKLQNRHKVRLGLLGSGTVGEAVQDFVFKQAKAGMLNGVDLEIVKIYTRQPRNKKWYRSHRSLFTTKAEEVIDHPAADIIVEALGFDRESRLNTYKDYFIRAFRNGKSVVTSDKAVLAKFGEEIWACARQYGRELRFEACVGGGIPIIRSLTESFAGEEPESIYGIVNGTCNYILSEMQKSGKSYASALREAQNLGYAESNPKSDTSGIDAEAKLILLAAVTFGLHVEPGIIWRQGIDKIQAIDFLYADRKGCCTIKHLAVANDNGHEIQAFVSPVLVPYSHFLATIDGSTNAIFFKGKRSGAAGGEEAKRRDWNYVFVGPGAGGGPTAVAILGDVCELARGGRSHKSVPGTLLSPASLPVQSQNKISASFYVRFIVKDRPGIVGDICRTFGKKGINIAEIWQLGHSEDELQGLVKSYRLGGKAGRILPFVITLEQATVGQIKNALGLIGQKDYILVDPVWFPIWKN